MADKYDQIRLESFGLSVTMDRHLGDFSGTRVQLIDAGLVSDRDFPSGRKFIGRQRLDEFGNSMELRRMRAGHYRVRVYWSADFDEWLRKEALVQARTDALPKNATEYRAALRQAVSTAIDALRRFHLERPMGGFRLKIDRSDMMDAFGPWYQLIENAPVTFSREERAAEVRRYQSESAVLDPRAKAFVRRVTRPRAIIDDTDTSQDAGPQVRPSTTA
jgi:hypothetical protein